jgi:hypothetical protein
LKVTDGFLALGGDTGAINNDLAINHYRRDQT